MKRTFARRPATAAAVLSVLALTSPVRADARGDTPTKLWLEARPFTCSEHLSSLARELTLACDAAGGSCVVAASEAGADKRLVLYCAEAQWRLQALTPSGEGAWSVEVYGSDADRVRSAAVFAVRAETPERAVGGEALPPTPAERPRPLPIKARPTPASAAAGVESESGQTTDAASSSRFSVAAAPRVGVAVSGGNVNPDSTKSVVGGAVYAAARVSGELRLGITGAAEAGFTEGDAHSHLSGGLFVGYGAPFARVPFGALLEGTYGGIQLAESRSAEVFASMRGALVYQVYEASSVRPWISPWVRGVLDRDSQAGALAVQTGVDLGVAWDP